MAKMIDPPSGWMYGFPKPIPEDVKDVISWLIDNGYPKEEIDKCDGHFYCRCWEKPENQTPLVEALDRLIEKATQEGYTSLANHYLEIKIQFEDEELF